LKKEISKCSGEVADHDDRIDSMTQHLKNVRQELSHNLVSKTMQLSEATAKQVGVKSIKSHLDL